MESPETGKKNMWSSISLSTVTLPEGACVTCGGEGQVVLVLDSEESEVCPECKGSGNVSS